MITLNKYQELLKEVEQIKDKSNFDTLLGLDKFSEINQIWKGAIYYNRLQNQLKRDNDNDSIVRVVNLWDETIQDVKNFAIKAKHNYTRLQWFKITIAANYFHFTYQELKELLK